MHTLVLSSSRAQTLSKILHSDNRLSLPELIWCTITWLEIAHTKTSEETKYNMFKWFTYRLQFVAIYNLRKRQTNCQPSFLVAKSGSSK